MFDVTIFLMLVSLSNFDPIVFLEIDTASYSADEITKMRSSLMSKIGEYILLKFSENLTQEQFNQVSSIRDGSQLINVLKNFIPDFDSKILQEVENFKTEYKQILKGEQING